MTPTSRALRKARAALPAAFASIALALSFGPAALAQDGNAAAQASVSNPYGLDALWAQGDLVSKATLVILVILSAASWYVIATKLYEQQKLRSHAKQARKNFWNAGGVEQATQALTPHGAFRFIAQAGLDARKTHTGLREHIDLNTWVGQSIQRAIDNVQSRLQDGLTLLGTVGSTSPFVGLFGTVWGIYHALTAIGIAGQASIDKVAGPVGEALIMTAIGLAVAVPAVLGYNWLVRRNKAALDEVRAFAVDLHAVLLGGANVNATASVNPQTEAANHSAPAKLVAARA
ncbi:MULTISPECIES: MotA/TolQ/ExbB proton channel family protein [unclassified Variovorax]|uniref:MotA/TolQ/ExbB proton channel family protein n=1 Tax=unclassified Variovorax TaxID=663243 RepID=UPI00257699A0|nr:MULTISPECIES: MotA/TolQ/ExbB proton channel family protein [unclassified Variovorax]MDM0087212.1 MotA/TolQ/ExbB proton channel family protein [Variovorax sp. J22G40]MDM0144531.1 MotA/TolQ/ExbB proton channel family protein [Variovorax sp. J2P1-31]